MPKKTHTDWIKFLGTAGARYVMARQLRYSAGTFLNIAGNRMILDPGPGTLLRCAKSDPPIDPAKLDAILLSHAHIDHSGDANALIDAMTCGGWNRRGRFYAPEECLRGENRVLLNYIKEAPAEVITLHENSRYELNGLKFSTSPRHDHDVDTFGFKFYLRGGLLSFVTDTLYSDGLADDYAGSRWMVINVVRQTGCTGRKLKHMSLREAEELIGRVRPQRAILTHFGMTIVNKNPALIARDMSNRVGTEIVAATDGMRLEMEPQPARTKRNTEL